MTHRYAISIARATGLTSERVLVNMDTEVHPELINSRFAYVSVSRASHDAQVYTNDATTLAQKLSRAVSKTSALDLPAAQHAVMSKGGPEQATLSKNPGAVGFELSLGR